MKKFLKVIIALLVIVALAVGAYFIFGRKDNSRAIFNNVYEISYNVSRNNQNVVNKVNEAVDQMLEIIETNDLDVGTAQAGLQNFVKLRDNYGKVEQEILSYGNFVTQNSQVNKNLSQANKSFKAVKSIYIKAYEYLNQTYFKIIGTSYNMSTMASYIVNFENAFKDIYADYNNFYFNTAVAYAHCLDNMMVKNNAYKLKIEYVANLINNFYSNGDFKTVYLDEISSQVQKLNQDFTDTYFENKSDFDTLFSNSLSYNINIICEKIISNEIDSYIEELATEGERQTITKYVNLVARG